VIEASGGSALPDISRLARRSALDAVGARRDVELRAAELSDFERAVLGVVLEVADTGANRTTATPGIVPELVGLSRMIATERGERDGSSIRTGLRRIANAKTLHLLREAGLYEDGDGVQPVWPHAGMLILNTMLGCSFGCAYCFRADEQQEGVEWFLSGRPTQVVDEATVVDRLSRHPLFIPGATQIGLHSATTEPFLPQVRESTFALLDLLESSGWGNDVMIITKHFLREEDVDRLAAYRSFQVLLFLTHNAAPAAMETMGAGAGFLERKLRTVEHVLARPNLAAAHYYRPIVPGWNDAPEQIEAALRFGEPLGLTVIGGLKEIPHLKEISAQRGLPLPLLDETAGRDKHFPPELVDRILKIHREFGLTSTIVGDQSCGLTVMLSRLRGRPVPNVEATRMYDLATGRPAKCMGLCSPEQLAACTAPSPPQPARVEALLHRFGVTAEFTVAPDGVRLHSVRQPDRQVIDALAAHLRFAVHWHGDRQTAATPPVEE
jgi:pyruvate-formate lyase-activating enzyme